MSFFNSLNNKSKQFDSPFRHWELNEPLTSEAINEIIKAGNQGCLILGICNGFQILTETGLLKGALLQNKNLKLYSANL